MRVRVRYFAGAAAAAGTPEVDVELPGDATVADLLERLGRDDERLARVLAVSTALVDGAAAGPAVALREGAAIDILPPFAGG